MRKTSRRSMREMEKKSCAHIPTVYYAAAILVKLNSYCPSFMHLPTVTLSAVDYFFLICNS